MRHRMTGHALLKPDYEPWRCRCGWQGDWLRSEDYPGGWVRAEARAAYRAHLQDTSSSPKDGSTP